MDPLWLNAVNIVFGTIRARKLVQFFGSPERVWRASSSALLKLNISSENLKNILHRKELVDPQKVWDKTREKDINLVTIDDKDYPKLLKEISSPPLALYIKGNRRLMSQSCLAVVGTRALSSYGKEVLPAFVEPLSRSGLVIVSGLAQGIDALAHQFTLRAGGETIAVLGCGLDQVFPKINSGLAKKILASGGLLTSEYPIGALPYKQHFPARNRIIAGLCLGVFVIESRNPGGALITARYALEANREVFALPGPVNRPTSQGTNSLIQQGAKLVSTADDILEELALPLAKEKLANVNVTVEERKVLNILETEPLHIDTIIKEAKLEPATLNALITSLELKGAVKNTGGNVYMRVA